MQQKFFKIVLGLLFVLTMIFASCSLAIIKESKFANKRADNLDDSFANITSDLSSDLSAGTVKYMNDEYRFELALPDSWKGFSVVPERWEGEMPGDGEQILVAEGPEILLRHPLWTSQKPRQDIPIMVFTISQWNDMQQDKFHIGAAPINPSELGRNAKYVFALPARYNYAFPEGYEEVEKILENKPLHTF